MAATSGMMHKLSLLHMVDGLTVVGTRLTAAHTTSSEVSKSNLA